MAKKFTITENFNDYLPEEKIPGRLIISSDGTMDYDLDEETRLHLGDDSANIQGIEYVEGKEYTMPDGDTVSGGDYSLSMNDLQEPYYEEKSVEHPKGRAYLADGVYKINNTDIDPETFQVYAGYDTATKVLFMTVSELDTETNTCDLLAAEGMNLTNISVGDVVGKLHPSSGLMEMSENFIAANKTTSGVKYNEVFPVYTWKRLSGGNITTGNWAKTSGYGNFNEGGKTVVNGQYNRAGYKNFGDINKDIITSQSTVGGMYNTVFARHSSVEGYGNYIEGEEGDFNDSINVSGYNNYGVRGTGSDIGGQKNILLRAARSIIRGYKNITKADWTAVFGTRNIATNDGQTVVGMLNNPDESVNDLFTVGNGTQATTKDNETRFSRGNAFGVKKDGTAYVTSQGTASNSVVQKEYVDREISESAERIEANIENEMGSIIEKTISDALDAKKVYEPSCFIRTDRLSTIEKAQFSIKDIFRRNTKVINPIFYGRNLSKPVALYDWQYMNTYPFEYDPSTGDIIAEFSGEKNAEPRLIFETPEIPVGYRYSVGLKLEEILSGEGSITIGVSGPEAETGTLSQPGEIFINHYNLVGVDLGTRVDEVEVRGLNIKARFKVYTQVIPAEEATFDDFETYKEPITLTDEIFEIPDGYSTLYFSGNICDVEYPVSGTQVLQDFINGIPFKKYEFTPQEIQTYVKEGTISNYLKAGDCIRFNGCDYIFRVMGINQDIPEDYQGAEGEHKSLSLMILNEYGRHTFCKSPVLGTSITEDTGLASTSYLNSDVINVLGPSEWTGSTNNTTSQNTVYDKLGRDLQNVLKRCKKQCLNNNASTFEDKLLNYNAAIFLPSRRNIRFNEFTAFPEATEQVYDYYRMMYPFEEGQNTSDITGNSLFRVSYTDVGNKRPRVYMTYISSNSTTVLANSINENGNPWNSINASSGEYYITPIITIG